MKPNICFDHVVYKYWKILNRSRAKQDPRRYAFVCYNTFAIIGNRVYYKAYYFYVITMLWPCSRNRYLKKYNPREK